MPKRVLSAPRVCEERHRLTPGGALTNRAISFTQVISDERMYVKPEPVTRMADVLAPVSGSVDEVILTLTKGLEDATCGLRQILPVQASDGSDVHELEGSSSQGK